MICPIARGYLTKGYRPKGDPEHYGVDVGWISYAITDPEIFSWNDGVVMESTFDTKGGGNVVAIKHFGNDHEYYLTRYVHLKSRKVEKGDLVRGGQVIGIGGRTGTASGLHLHFEIWRCPNTFTYETISNSNRRSYAINPLDMVNWFGVNPNGKGETLIYGVDKSKLPIARTEANRLHMRIAPNTNAMSVGFMPRSLFCLGETTLANGHKWAIMLFENQVVYSSMNWTDIDGGTQIIEIVKPIDETVENDDYVISIKATPKETNK